MDDVKQPLFPAVKSKMVNIHVEIAPLLNLASGSVCFQQIFQIKNYGRLAPKLISPQPVSPQPEVD